MSVEHWSNCANGTNWVNGTKWTNIVHVHCTVHIAKTSLISVIHTVLYFIQFTFWIHSKYIFCLFLLAYSRIVLKQQNLSSILHRTQICTSANLLSWMKRERDRSLEGGWAILLCSSLYLLIWPSLPPPHTWIARTRVSANFRQGAASPLYPSSGNTWSAQNTVQVNLLNTWPAKNTVQVKLLNTWPAQNTVQVKLLNSWPAQNTVQVKLLNET